MSRQATSDRLMACKDCGDNFVWTAAEQDYYQAQGYDAPKRCKPCRQARKARNQEREQRSGRR